MYRYAMVQCGAIWQNFSQKSSKQNMEPCKTTNVQRAYISFTVATGAAHDILHLTLDYHIYLQLQK